MSAPECAPLHHEIGQPAHVYGAELCRRFYSGCPNTVLMGISILSLQKSLETASEAVSADRVLKIMFV